MRGAGQGVKPKAFVCPNAEGRGRPILQRRSRRLVGDSDNTSAGTDKLGNGVLARREVEFVRRLWYDISAEGDGTPTIREHGNELITDPPFGDFGGCRVGGAEEAGPWGQVTRQRDHVDPVAHSGLRRRVER